MKFDAKFVNRIAELAQLAVDPQQATAFAPGFSESMSAVERLTNIPTTNTPPTYQVNNLVNVWREDIVDPRHTFTQDEALANARQVHQGYIVVERLIDHETE
jgi:aspartyl-tRNA(Asn)/glutamyl-tRNA(Gln) amidotransferase subunit C